MRFIVHFGIIDCYNAHEGGRPGGQCGLDDEHTVETTRLVSSEQTI